MSEKSSTEYILIALVVISLLFSALSYTSISPIARNIQELSDSIEGIGDISAITDITSDLSEDIDDLSTGIDAILTKLGEEVEPDEPDEPEPDVIKTGGILRIAMADSPKGLDPHLETAGSSQEIYEFFYDRLIRFNYKMELEGELADSWEVSDDATTFVFHLKKGVKFHNGREMTSADVKYSFERMRELHPWLMGWFTIIESIEIPTDYTVIIKTNQPSAHFLSMVADHKVCIVSKETVEEHGNLQRVPGGTGPFTLEYYEPSTLIKLRKNEYFDKIYPGLPYLDGIDMYIIIDEGARLEALKAGEVDMIFFDSADALETLESHGGFTIMERKSLTRDTFVINCAEPPFDDVRVRQAFSIAINRQEMIDTALGGAGELIGIFVEGFGQWALPLEELPFYPLGYTEQGIDEAKTLLAEADYPDGVSFTITAPSTYPNDVRRAEVAKEQIKAAGMDITIEVVEWGVLIDMWVRKDFTVFSMGYAGRTDPYFYTYDRYHSDSTGNAAQIKDDIIDELCVKGYQTAGDTERKEIYDELQYRILEQAPHLWISPSMSWYAMEPCVEGFIPQLVGITHMYLQEVWLDK